MSAAAPHRWPIRVYWEDTDASGVVYHANYLRWFERGRSEWLRDLGCEQTRLAETQGVAFAVASLSIEYRKPARLDDALLVLSELAERGRASLDFRQTLVRESDLDVVLATAVVRVACVDAQRFVPRRLPELGI